MGGGLIQLVAYGAQDVYLTGNPQITFFKVVYRRHTNFSMECIEVPIDSANFGNTTNVQILRNGDLAHKIYIKTTLPSLPKNHVYVQKPGFALIKSIECTIGGSKIDKHSGLLYDIWYDLTHLETQEDGYNKMIGNVPELTNIYYNNSRTTNSSVGTPAYTLYIPIQFWFNRNVGLALPLIALQYHEVRISIEFEELTTMVGNIYPTTETLNCKLSNTSLLVDYIYLDQEERRRIAQVGHEFLIEQTQYDSESIIGSNQKFSLDFNHPCKEIAWVTLCGMFSGKTTYFADYYKDQKETLDFAATNIVTQMISYLKDDDDPTKYTPSNDWYKLSDFIGSNPSINSNITNTFTIGVGNDSNKKININILNKDNVTRQLDNTRIYYINNKMFKYDNKNLCDRINEFTLNFYIEDDITYLYDNSNLSILKDNINVKHNLMIEDISIPVALFTTKTKYYNAISTSLNIRISHKFNYGLDLAGNGNLVSTAKIQLNGHDRFDVQSGDYFNYVQPSQHHRRTPHNGVYVYSFGLLPEQHQPSGTCNLSRIDTSLLLLTFSDTLRARYPDDLMQISNILNNSYVLICVVNYNVLRCMSGMSGVAYAN